MSTGATTSGLCLSGAIFWSGDTARQWTDLLKRALSTCRIERRCRRPRRPYKWRSARERCAATPSHRQPRLSTNAGGSVGAARTARPLDASAPCSKFRDTMVRASSSLSTGMIRASSKSSPVWVVHKCVLGVRSVRMRLATMSLQRLVHKRIDATPARANLLAVGAIAELSARATRAVCPQIRPYTRITSKRLVRAGRRIRRRYLSTRHSHRRHRAVCDLRAKRYPQAASRHVFVHSRCGVCRESAAACA